MRRQKNFASPVVCAQGRQGRAAFRLTGVAVFALSLGACSSDMSRFSGNPFSNPFSQTAQARDPGTTGSLAKNANAGFRPVQSAQVANPIQSSPLAPPSVASAPLTAQQGVSPAMERAAMQTGSLGTLAGAQTMQQAAPATRPLAARVAGVTGNAAGWTAEGGTPVVLAHGETVDTLSQRYGVPSAAILSANRLSSASQATPGSRVIIPVYNVEATRAPAQRVAAANTVQSDADLARPQRIQAPQPAPAQPMRQAAPAADPVRPASRPPAPVAQPQQPQRGMTAAEMRAQSAQKQQEATAKAKEAAEAKARQAAEAKAKAAQAKTEQAKPAEQARQKVAALAPATEPKTTSSIPKDVETPKAETPKAETSSKADFRWPARGRIINGFSGRGGNEGINIAVPEGTPVKAAEGGTVAYAGSELKGYGNLVLIRHDNGYVSAYAHNGEINVKRGQKVNRGEVIAKSGQTGNVASPQLHFELRKGSTPVDPTPYLQN